MRLFLASQDFGKHSDKFVELLGENKKVVLIQNAKDYYEKDAREKSTEAKMKMVADLGLAPVELDLRRFFGKENELKDYIEKEDFGGVWCTGGEPFLLLSAFKRSGFDKIIKENLKSDNFVFGGFSAGAMVACPDLIIYDRNMRSELVKKIYSAEVIYEGLNLIPEYILPHFGQPERDALLNERLEKIKSEGEIAITLTDDEVYVINGKSKIKL